MTNPHYHRLSRYPIGATHTNTHNTTQHIRAIISLNKHVHPHPLTMLEEIEEKKKKIVLEICSLFPVACVRERSTSFYVFCHQPQTKSGNLRKRKSIEV